MIGSTAFRRWPAVVLGALICAVVVYAPGPDRTLRSAVAIHDFGHVVAFGLVAVLLAIALSSHSRPTLRRRVTTACVAAVAAVLLGAAVECLQGVSGGNADVWDIVRNAGGAAAAALLLIAAASSLATKTSIAIASVAAAIVVAFASPAVIALRDEARASAQFPVLANFERTGDLARFGFNSGATGRIVATTNAAGSAMSGLELHLPPGGYPGLSLDYFPRDWSDMRALRLLIVNPEATPLDITVRIDDAQHDQRYEDRFNRAFPIQPGMNQLEIPLADVRTAPRDRELDLTRVASLIMFAVDLARPREIVIGPIVLVR